MIRGKYFFTDSVCQLSQEPLLPALKEPITYGLTSAVWETVFDAIFFLELLSGRLKFRYCLLHCHA